MTQLRHVFQMQTLVSCMCLVCVNVVDRFCTVFSLAVRKYCTPVVDLLRLTVFLS